ncbi:MAG: FtsQ-type POTRA domain-containing protein [Verrucomicrobiales bacterium]|nr:FtsQ-type POTRA domain-containing protein [Verrucomicrobiales bacterium]
MSLFQSQSRPRRNATRLAPRKRKAKPGAVLHQVELNPETPKTRWQTRLARRKKGFVLGVTLLLAFCLAALASTVWKQAFDRNPLYGLKHVKVVTEGILTGDDIAKDALGLTIGMDTLLMNHREQRETLERLPEVKEAHVEKDLQGNLTITVEQRRPVAWLECQRLGLLSGRSGLGCLLDAEGVAIPCRVMLKSFMSLPVIRFEGLSQVHPGAVVPDHQVTAALRLLREMETRIDSGMAGVEAVEIPVKYAVTVRFRDGLSTTFCPDRLDHQLPRFDRVMSEARRHGWKVATLDLLPEHNVPITFAEPPAILAQTRP